MKVNESNPWVLILESCSYKGVEIIVKPYIVYGNTILGYMVRKGSKFAVNNKNVPINFNSIDAAEGFINRKKGKI